jgi:hypothetical protein
MTDFPTDSSINQQVRALCREAFGPAAPPIVDLHDANRGRGAFSLVVRAELARAEDPNVDVPPTVVAKLPAPGANGRAATDSGAYLREAMAYRTVLPRSPIRAPALYAIQEPGDRTSSLLLGDLGDKRSVDQLDGLTGNDALEVATSLARFHRFWVPDGPGSPLADLEVRRNTLAQLPHQALRTGLATVEQRWADTIPDGHLQVLGRLVERHETLARHFGAQPPTLCHGDPRADNLFFADDGLPILLDWQQMAVQFGEADLAWLAATSLDVTVRRKVERDLLVAAGGTIDRYRLGLALPGLAVLLLAQRDLVNERARRLVAMSLQRIAAAVADHEVPDY